VTRRKGQQAAASMSPHVGAGMLMRLWEAAPGRGGMTSFESPRSLQESRAKFTCLGLLYGWDSLCSHQLLPVAISYSWVWERGGRGGIAVMRMLKNLVHSQKASKEPRKLFPLNS